jgi:transposase-like protein
MGASRLSAGWGYGSEAAPARGPGDKWRLDEVFVGIQGKLHYLTSSSG